MKIGKFLLITLFIFILNIQNLLADDAKMIKGLEIFNETAGCAGCHTLKAAGSDANIGPNLDQLKPTLERIVNVVNNGIGVMPPWEGILTVEEIDAVAHYVFSSTNK